MIDQSEEFLAILMFQIVKFYKSINFSNLKNQPIF